MIKKVNYATYAVSHCDDLRIISFDKGFLELTGYEETDIHEKKLTLKDLIPSDLWEEYLTALNSASQSKSGSGYLEHPILKKDGSSIVVFCFGKKRNDSSGISDVLITDVTSHIQAQNIILKQAVENRLWLKKLSFISENEEDYILDYNCRTDHFNITIIKDGEAKHIYCIDDYSSTLSKLPTMHPDDREEYRKIFKEAPSLPKKAVFDFRSTLFSREYSWYRSTYGPYHDRETGETHIIGRIINIDQEISKNEELRRHAQIDAITTLYNQGACRTKIDEIALENPEHCKNAFILMDLDNFREFNDRFGHARGDDVLKKIGDILKHFFNFGPDIIGHPGGDEFIIFIRDIPSAELVQKYCEDLCLEISSCSFSGKNKFHLTASIGIVIQDDGPDSFDYLYRCADEALYDQKRDSKNGVCFYKPRQKS